VQSDATQAVGEDATAVQLGSDSFLLRHKASGLHLRIRSAVDNQEDHNHDVASDKDDHERCHTAVLALGGNPTLDGACAMKHEKKKGRELGKENGG
jgi:hypothetical protein